MIDTPPENITYFYSEFQNTFGEIQALVPQNKFVQGLPDDIMVTINPETRNLFIVDDMMGEKDAIIAKLFTKKSHHGNLSVIYTPVIEIPNIIIIHFFIGFFTINEH